MACKNGVIPKGNNASHLRICVKCDMKHFYYGSAFPDKVEKCDGCLLKKETKKKKGYVKRNPRIIKRNTKIIRRKK